MTDEVSSPCTGICTLDGEDLCIGCGRTIGEIVEWANASAERKREIATMLAGRLLERAARN